MYNIENHKASSTLQPFYFKHMHLLIDKHTTLPSKYYLSSAFAMWWNAALILYACQITEDVFANLLAVF